MPAAACSKLCSSVSAWMDVFASIAIMHSYIASSIPIQYFYMAQSARVLGYTDSIFAEGVRLLPTSDLDMTLNNLMVRLLLNWSFGECGVLLHYNYSQVHSSLEW